MMRDVPFEAARDPGAEQADQGRFDHMLAVNEVIVVGLVNAFEDAAAHLRKDADTNVLIFEIDNGISFVDFLAGQRVVHGIGIDRRQRALGLTPEEEHRIRFRISGQVSRDNRLCLPNPHRGSVGGKGCGRRKQKLRQDEYENCLSANHALISLFLHDSKLNLWTGSPSMHGVSGLPQPDAVILLRSETILPE